MTTTRTPTITRWALFDSDGWTNRHFIFDTAEQAAQFQSDSLTNNTEDTIELTRMGHRRTGPIVCYENGDPTGWYSTRYDRRSTAGQKAVSE